MGFFQFEIIINVSVSPFWFIWIPMLWVYNHYKYVYPYSAGIDFSLGIWRIQIPTTKVDPRAVRVKNPLFEAFAIRPKWFKMMGAVMSIHVYILSTNHTGMQSFFHINDANLKVFQKNSSFF